MTVTLVLPARTMDDLAAALETLTEHIVNKAPEREVSGFLGGRFGYGAEWSSPVFEMHPDGDYDCDCGQDDVALAHEPPMPNKRFRTRSRMRRYWKTYNAWSEQFPCLPTCITARPNFRHHASGLEVRWYKYIGRSMEVAGSGDVAAILAECIADVAAPPFEPWKEPPFDPEAFNRFCDRMDAAMACDHDMRAPTDGLCPGCGEKVEPYTPSLDDDIPF